MINKHNKSWYDPEMDILYIQVHEGELADSKEIAEDIQFDLDENGNILGIEIHHARKRVLEPVSSEIHSIISQNIQPVSR